MHGAAFLGWKPWISIRLSLILLRIFISLLLPPLSLLLRLRIECSLVLVWLPNLKSMKTAEIYTLLNRTLCINRIVIIDDDGDDDGGDNDNKLRWSFYNVNSFTSSIAFMYDITVYDVLCKSPLVYPASVPRWRYDTFTYPICTLKAYEKDQLYAVLLLCCNDSCIVFYVVIICFIHSVRLKSWHIYSFMAVLLSVHW